MSDILVSEILVLVLLMFPAIRPFSKRLKAVSAIVIFPIFALIILTFIVLGQGLFFSILPIIVVLIITIITEFSRFVMMLRGIPNSFYTIYSIILRIFVLILIVLAGVTSFYFSPEREVACNFNKFTKKEITIDNTQKIVGAHFFNLKGLNENTHILIIDSFSSSSKIINSISRYFLFENFDVTQCNPEIILKKVFFSRQLELISILNSIKNKNNLSSMEMNLSFEEFSEIIDQTIASIKENSDANIYVFSEGKYNDFLYDYSVRNPKSFAGVFFSIGEENLKPFEKKISNLKDNAFYILDARSELKFSKNIVQFPYCLFIQEKDKLASFGDLRGNDVFASILLGATRDLGRQDRLVVAKSFEKWLWLK